MQLARIHLLVPNSWYLVLDRVPAWLPISSGLGSLTTWYLTLGTWYLVYTWYLVPSSWYLMFTHLLQTDIATHFSGGCNICRIMDNTCDKKPFLNTWDMLVWAVVFNCETWNRRGLAEKNNVHLLGHRVDGCVVHHLDLTFSESWNFPAVLLRFVHSQLWLLIQSRFWGTFFLLNCPLSFSRTFSLRFSQLLSPELMLWQLQSSSATAA